MFQLPEGVIPLDILQRMDQETPKTLNILIMNTNNTTCSLPKNLPITILVLEGGVKKFRRSVRPDCRIAQLNYSPKYLTILTYN